MNPLKRTGTDQGPGPTGLDRAVDRVERPLLQQVAGAVAGRSSLRATTLLPEAANVSEPESRRLVVQLHRGHVVLHIRVILFTLHCHILDGILAGRLRSAQERRAIVRAEARLPLVAEILARQTDQVVGGDECAVESRDVTDRCAHADRIPPRRVEAHARIREVAGHQQEPVGRSPVGVAGSPRARAHSPAGSPSLPRPRWWRTPWSPRSHNLHQPCGRSCRTWRFARVRATAARRSMPPRSRPVRRSPGTTALADAHRPSPRAGPAS